MSIVDQINLAASKPLGEAKSLSFESFSSQKAYEVEQATLFSQDWVFVCFEADIPSPGDYHCLEIAGEPIVVIRGQDAVLRALSNVCRHRGALLLEGNGQLKKANFSCPYHAWNYSDEGALKGVPYPGEVEVKKDAHCLPRFKLESMSGLVFVSLNKNAPPLAERFNGLQKYFLDYRVDEFNYSSGVGFERWNCNWKLAMENFLEGYHFFAVHKTTVEPAAPTRKVYYVEGHADWSISGGKQKDYTKSLLGKLIPKDEEMEYLTICMPPNFVGLLYKDHFSWARALPTGPTTCEISFGDAARYPYQPTKEELQTSDQFFTEDREICERVQKGMSSQRSAGGQLVELERPILDFHQYLGKWICGKDYSRFFRNEAVISKR